MGWSDIKFLVKRAFKEWSDDNAARLAAALSYYTTFALPPLLIIGIAIAGQVLGQQAAENQIVQQLEEVIGPQAAQFIQRTIERAGESGGGTFASIMSSAALIFAASGGFVQLQSALNIIWDVEPDEDRGLMATIIDRLFSFLLVIATAVLLLGFLILSSALSGITNFVADVSPATVTVGQILNIAVSVGLLTVIFALIYKVIPDVVIEWSDVWTGALMTAVLFVIGQFAISLYLGQSSIASTYGAAGSLVLLLLWIYYSAQIFFFGAELTQVYANHYGSHVVPEEDAHFERD